MKITYEFDPYEDRDELYTVQNASVYRLSVFTALEHIRSKLKHSQLTEEAQLELERLRQVIVDELGGINT